jgi:hypothetical protein
LQLALLVAAQNRGHKPSLEGIQLTAGIAQTCYANDRRVTNVQARATRQRKQVDSARSDILAKQSGTDLKPFQTKFAKQLFMDQVYLPQIRFTRIARNPGSVFNGHTKVSVALNTQSDQKTNRFSNRLAEIMFCVAAHRYDNSWHYSFGHAIIPCRPIYANISMYHDSTAWECPDPNNRSESPKNHNERQAGQARGFRHSDPY